MYTVSRSTQIVLALLKQHNIKHIVINPGTTNVPIVQGIQNDPFFTCYSVVDERSAMYFAIGLHLELKVPIATTCTSAQATRNYIPGLTEAFYKHIPILAITASKHPKYNYQGYPQAPIQTSLPEDAVKRTYPLPYVTTDEDELQCIRMVNEAMLELTHRTPGPVQINLPMHDPDLAKFTDVQLPAVRTIKRYMGWENWEISLKDKKIMIVIGEHLPFSEIQLKAIENFLESHNAFAYVNHLSNYHGKFRVLTNLARGAVSFDEFRTEYKPDVVITVGGQTADYPLIYKLTNTHQTDFEHWHVSKEGEVKDTFDKLTKVFECPEELFFSRLKGEKDVLHTYFEDWKIAYQRYSIPDNLPFSNIYLAQQLHNSIPKNSRINFGILNSLRMWSLFPLDPSIICHSNVAAFGIDGGLSVLLGQSVATDSLCFMVIGDLAFFYDMNALGIRHLKNNIRIILVNNGCGYEFRQNIPLYNSLGDDIFPFISAKGHSKNAKGWAETCGFNYLSANSKEEFIQHKEEFIGISEKSIVFEIFVTPDEELDAYFEALVGNNKDETEEEHINRRELWKTGKR